VATQSLPAAFLAAGLDGRVTLTVLEDANPDGRARGTRGNANGVDVNRNFPAANFDSRDPLFGGAPLSQPEAHAIATLLDEVQPDLVVVCHSWRGRSFINYDGPAVTLAERFASLSGLPVEASGDLGVTTPGSLGSFVGIDRQTPILTVELLRGTDPTRAWDQIRSASLAVIGG
jgi:hypothetical protein